MARLPLHLATVPSWPFLTALTCLFSSIAGLFLPRGFSSSLFLLLGTALLRPHASVCSLFACHVVGAFAWPYLNSTALHSLTHPQLCFPSWPVTAERISDPVSHCSIDNKFHEDFTLLTVATASQIVPWHLTGM